MGVNDTYIQVRINILMMKPIPTVSNVYNILLADEKQRQISCTSQFSSEFASFSAEVSTSKSCSGLSKQTFPSKVNFEPWMSSLLYKYCKKPGHSIDKCYKFHGFPSTFKFTRGSIAQRKWPFMLRLPLLMNLSLTNRCLLFLDLIRSNTLN
uniref:Putative ovule protein n=1 Tax=Solanum chacoense TaxID=4108 RepID=A0A0V0I3H5_SOLCH